MNLVQYSARYSRLPLHTSHSPTRSRAPLPSNKCEYSMNGNGHPSPASHISRSDYVNLVARYYIRAITEVTTVKREALAEARAANSGKSKWFCGMPRWLTELFVNRFPARTNTVIGRAATTDPGFVCGVLDRASVCSSVQCVGCRNKGDYTVPRWADELDCGNGGG